MGKDAYYFPHDMNARTDPKMQALYEAFEGAAGAGIYWALVETLWEQGGRLSLDAVPRIAHLIYERRENVLRVINDFGLFENDGKEFWSPALLARAEERSSRLTSISAARSEAGRRGAEARWGAQNGKSDVLSSEDDGKSMANATGSDSNKLNKEKREINNIVFYCFLFQRNFANPTHEAVRFVNHYKIVSAKQIKQPMIDKWQPEFGTADKVFFDDDCGALKAYLNEVYMTESTQHKPAAWPFSHIARVKFEGEKAGRKTFGIYLDDTARELLDNTPVRIPEGVCINEYDTKIY